MPDRIVEQARTRAGAADGLAIAGGALILLLALAAGLLFTGDTIARLAGARLLGPDEYEPVARYLSLAFAAASLLALPAVLAAPFARIGEPPLRSALALNPGAIIALVVWLAAFVAALFVTPTAYAGLMVALARATEPFESFVFIALPLACALGGAFGGARSSDSAAAAAAPAVLVVVCGLAADLSIGSQFLAVLLPLLGAAAAIAILYAFAPARAVTPWLAGIALAFGATLLIATGFVTPTEAFALIAFFGLPTALLVRKLALRQPLGAVLGHMAAETVSVAVALAAGSLVAPVLTFAELIPQPTTTGAPLALLLSGGAVFFAASVILTPVLALALTLPIGMAMLQPMGIEPMHAVSMMVILGLAAIAARAGRRGDAPDTAGLSRSSALVVAGALVALAALVAIEPRIALGPAEIMR